jgi:hypothetical protein
MKSWIILIVLAVAMTAAVTVIVPMLATDSTANGPAFPAPVKRAGPMPVAQVVEDLVYNFGALPQKYNGKHTWTFKNAGPGPLELRGAGQTCSCTAAAVFGKENDKEIVVQPNETFPVEVDFDTKDWNKDKWTQSVTVATNDPEHPTFVLRIEGIVKPAITTMPGDSSVSFGMVGNEEEVKRKIVVYSIDRPDLVLTKLTASNSELLGVASKPLTPEELEGINRLNGSTTPVQKGHMVEVTLKPTSHLGSFAEEVVIETDHPKKLSLPFKVSGKVIGPISTVPERVTIRGASTVKGGTELLKILDRNQASVNFTVASKPSALDVSIEPIAQAADAKGSMYKMVVKVLPGAESGRIVAEIILKTDDPKASEVKIPVDVIVQGAR